jgi:hypothetical protein
MEKYKFHLKPEELGQLDHHFVDDNDKKIATLLREPNDKGYNVITYFESNENKPPFVHTLIEGFVAVRKLLKKVGINADFQ